MLNTSVSKASKSTKDYDLNEKFEFMLNMLKKHVHTLDGMVPKSIVNKIEEKGLAYHIVKNYILFTDVVHVGNCLYINSLRVVAGGKKKVEPVYIKIARPDDKSTIQIESAICKYLKNKGVDRIQYPIDELEITDGIKSLVYPYKQRNLADIIINRKVWERLHKKNLHEVNKRLLYSILLSLKSLHDSGFVLGYTSMDSFYFKEDYKSPGSENNILVGNLSLFLYIDDNIKIKYNDHVLDELEDKYTCKDISYEIYSIASVFMNILAGDIVHKNAMMKYNSPREFIEIAYMLRLYRSENIMKYAIQRRIHAHPYDIRRMAQDVVCRTGPRKKLNTATNEMTEDEVSLLLRLFGITRDRYKNVDEILKDPYFASLNSEKYGF